MTRWKSTAFLANVTRLSPPLVFEERAWGWGYGCSMHVFTPVESWDGQRILGLMTWYGTYNLLKNFYAIWFGHWTSLITMMIMREINPVTMVMATKTLQGKSYPIVPNVKSYWQTQCEQLNLLQIHLQIKAIVSLTMTLVMWTERTV